ncbi:MAG TPA: HAMP domain-containing sensor histidine kinase, partial [Chloroflexota bacterium]|nr:HAMP domain-containing sensor histidine kinase [Chloroflexota bacterium]
LEPLSQLGHELKNLLATVLGFTELLLNEQLPVDQQREYLELIRQEGQRGVRLLHELLDLQRLESGQARPRVRPTDVRDLLVFGAAVAASDPAHPVGLDCPASLPPVLAEPDRIQQVLANLVANARAYSPNGAEIRIAARSWGAMVEVSVTDQGLGIPPEALPRLFDKFYRVSSPSHAAIRGSGLGLAICRHIIETHGGVIWAESAGLGRGARIAFTLPVVARPRPRSSARPAACAQAGRSVPTRAAPPLPWSSQPAVQGGREGAGLHRSWSNGRPHVDAARSGGTCAHRLRRRGHARAAAGRRLAGRVRR